MKWNNWLFKNYIHHTERHERTNCTMKQCISASAAWMSRPAAVDIHYTSSQGTWTFLFIHPSPHMLNSGYCNKSSSLWRKGKNPFTFLVEEGPALFILQAAFCQCSKCLLYCLVSNTEPYHSECCMWHHWSCWRGCQFPSQTQLLIDTETPKFQGLDIVGTTMSHTVATTSSPALWQVSRTSIKKLISTSPLVLLWIK